MYRGTPSEGKQWQQCWDSTQNIIEKCVANGPNAGWVNGPDPYQVEEISIPQAELMLTQNLAVLPGWLQAFEC